VNEDENDENTEKIEINKEKSNENKEKRNEGEDEEEDEIENESDSSTNTLMNNTDTERLNPSLEINSIKFSFNRKKKEHNYILYDSDEEGDNAMMEEIFGSDVFEKIKNCTVYQKKKKKILLYNI